jgi:LmbE family N-acetylglucosaminyl deacetylase
MAEEFRPRVVLGIAAHADDMDFSMAGSAAKWAHGGAKVYFLVLTNSDKGSDDTTTDPAKLAARRQQEQRAAAQLLGVSDVFFGNYEDGQLCVTPGLKRDIVRVLRRLRPDVVVTFDPSMMYYAPEHFINHPDHRAAGQAALDAVFPLARDHLSFPELYEKEGLEPHKVSTLLLVNFEKADFSVDISGYIDKKLDALAAHASQMKDLRQIQDKMRARAAAAGKRAGMQYAESFLRIDVER